MIANVGWVGNLYFEFVSTLDLRVGDSIEFRMRPDSRVDIVRVLPRKRPLTPALAPQPVPLHVPRPPLERGEAGPVKQPRLESSAVPAPAAPGASTAPLQRPDAALTLTIKKVYLGQIFERRKTVEGRINAGGVAKLRVGDCVALRPGQFAKERWYVRIKRTRPFNSFEEMLQACGVQACLPDARGFDEALAVYHSFPGFEEKAREEGVLALDVEPIARMDADGNLHQP